MRGGETHGRIILYQRAHSYRALMGVLGVFRIDSRLRGNDVMSCGNDVVGCGNDVVGCGNGVVGCGNDVMSCGNDVVGTWE